jgi:hypothetical protein
VKAKVAELPAGSAGKGTLQFTNCWGMAADSPNQKAALDLVEYLTSADQQLAFSKAFGPMPSVQSAAQTWKSDNPSLVAFLNGADYAQGVPTNKGAADVIKDFNAQLESLKTATRRRSSTRCSPTSRPSSADHVRFRRPGRDASRPAPPRHPRSRGIRRGEAGAGWLFVSPVILILGVFLLVPVLMALWVSFSDWSGRGSPLSGSVGFVGLDNYAAITTGGGLAERDFGTALRNNAWYVLLVVPLQTVLSLFLAVLVSRRILRGRGFFRTAFYFPSVTSSVAITVLWLFLFSFAGPVNQIMSAIGVAAPNWFSDPRGIVHVALGAVGVSNGPDALTGAGFSGSRGGTGWRVRRSRCRRSC